jgi:magnesium transporter
MRHTVPGTAPGLLVNREPVADEALHFTLVEYTKDSCEIFHEVAIDECSFRLSTPANTWIDVAGRPSAEMLKSLGDDFHLHSLALEDVFHANQRSKLEIYDRQNFLVLNDPSFVDGELRSRQVSIFFGRDFVISFHDHLDDLFRPVRERLQNPEARLRAFGTDYLVYALLDLVVDRKFPLLAEVSARVEELEEEALDRPTRETLRRVHSARRGLVALHRVQWAEREAVLAMMRPEVPFIASETRTYLRDVFDHTVSVLELVESYREMANGVMEVYLMDSSNRMNEVMKTLAIITAFFMPLSFLAGVYGMNFDRGVAGNMPELGWEYGYIWFWVMVVGIVAGLYIWMRRKGWFN